MTCFEQLLVGRVLAGRYRVDELLARGGMGAVFRSHDLRLEREVAFKIVTSPPGLSRESRELLRARFQREARTAASIAHPGVVTVHDSGVDEELDLDYLVMELLAGEDLGARIAGGWRPGAEELAGLAAQAADGLAAGHARGVVHRDVKPGNLFVTGYGAAARIRVLDFGIAQPTAVTGTTLTHLTGGGAHPRTPGFAAPEQLAGGAITPAADVYSLGLTAIAALAGGSPEDPWGTLNGLERESPGLAAVLRRALHEDPLLRFADCAEMGDALRRLPGVQPPSSARPGTRLDPKRRFVVLAALAVLALALWIASRPRAPGAPPETEAEAVAAARAVFREVNAGSGRMTRRYNANGRAMAYLDRSGVRKLVTRAPTATREVYFDRHGPRFAYERETGGGVHRYYFTSRGELARHFGVGVSAGDDREEHARELQQTAASAAAEAPGWPAHRCTACDSLP